MPTDELRTMSDEELSAYLVEQQVDDAGLGAMQTNRGNLPLDGVDIDVRIVGLLSRIFLHQTFVNGHDVPLEATYIFPLPDRAAVTSYALTLGDHRIEGVLKERGAARLEYEEAIDAGNQASIVEEERPDIFTIRVGNIPAGATAVVEFEMTSPLLYADSEATFRFPLVVAPRYIPGEPLTRASVGDGTATDTDAVPDASRITPPVLLPGFPNPVRLSLTVDLDPGGLHISNLCSSLRNVSVEWGESGRSRLRLFPGERLDQDFFLRFTFEEEEVQTSLVHAQDDAGEEGTFVLTLVPTKGDSALRSPRDVLFVLDRSGSMNGWKMVAARRAMGRMVDTLGPGDRFMVIAFDNEVETPEHLGSDLVDATNRNRYRAIEFLSQIDARGGTEIASPLLQALQMLSNTAGDRRRQLVLVTDGQVGNERQILKAARKRMHPSINLFTVGIDEAVNASFLKGLAKLGRGRCELIESEDRLDQVMSRLHRSIDTPLLTDIDVALEGAELVTDTVTPQTGSGSYDVFEGTALRIAGRYRGHLPFSARITGRRSKGRPRAYETHIESTPITDEGSSLRACWARGHLRDLEDRYDVSEPDGGREKLGRNIVKTSLQCNVLCRFTSFVAVDSSTVFEDGGTLQRVIQPVEPPRGWDMMASGAWQSSDCHEQGRTQTGTMRGKFLFLSPARARGELLRPADDLFSLGLILYRLLKGRHLFSAETEFMTLQKIVSWNESDLRTGAHDLGPFLPILEKALAADVRRRFQDGAAFLHAIERLIDAESYNGGAAARELGRIVRSTTSRPRPANGPPVEPGTGLGPYRILEMIMPTSTSDLYLAERDDGLQCVIRRPLEYVSEDPELIRAIMNPITTRHPNIVAPLDRGSADGVPFVALEYIKGVNLGSLQRALSEGSDTGLQPLEPALVAYIAREVARALAFLHGLRNGSGEVVGMVLGHLKPSKVLIGSDGEIKITEVSPAPPPSYTFPQGDEGRSPSRKIRKNWAFWK